MYWFTPANEISKSYNESPSTSWKFSASPATAPSISAVCVSSPNIARYCCPSIKSPEAKDVLPTTNPEFVVATTYGESDEIGRALTSPDVKNTVIFTPVFPENSFGNTHPR